MEKHVLIDSGYWFGLYDKLDSYHNAGLLSSKNREVSNEAAANIV